MVLVATILWTSLAGVTVYNSLLLLALAAVAAVIVWLQQQQNERLVQLQRAQTERDKALSKKSTTSSSSPNATAAAAAAAGDDDDAVSVASDGALSDANSAIAPIAASAESVPDEDSTTAEDAASALDTDTPEQLEFAFKSVDIKSALSSTATTTTAAPSTDSPPVAASPASVAAAVAGSSVAASANANANKTDLQSAAAAAAVSGAGSGAGKDELSLSLDMVVQMVVTEEDDADDDNVDDDDLRALLLGDEQAPADDNNSNNSSNNSGGGSNNADNTDDEEKPALLAWEAMQRVAEEAEAARAEAAAAATSRGVKATAAAAAVAAAAAAAADADADLDDADALDELLAGVAAADPDADADAEVRVSAATATTDTTEKAASFWVDFEEKVVVVAAEAAADTAVAGSGGDDTGQSSLDVARAMQESSRALPDKLAAFSTSGIVKCGHVDIDSEDEADELLADTVISGSSRFDIGFADTKGLRSTMEDEMVVYGTFRDSPLEDYVAVFDGHGGSEASAVAAEELHELLATHLDAAQYAADPGAALKAAFESCQRTIEQAVPAIQSGTTAVVAYFQGQRCWVANAGDSRAIVCRRAKGVAAGSVATPLDLELTRVTTDHKPSLPAEEARIKAAGGFVTRTQTKRGEVSRVCAVLGVARALGDTFLQPMVTCMPDVFDVPFADNHALILACDGLWDVVSDAEAAAVTLNSADAGEAARRLRDFAYARNSDDNISVLVVFFNNGSA